MRSSGLIGFPQQFVVASSLIALLFAASMTNTTAQSLFVDEASPRSQSFWCYQEIHPVGQEFVPDLPRLDFVTLTLTEYGGDFDVAIRDGLTEKIIGISGRHQHTTEASGQIVFAFEPSLQMRPGSQYVIELQRNRWRLGNYWCVLIESPDGNPYRRGRMLSKGTPRAKDDLTFSTGIFVPNLVPPDQRLLIYTQQLAAILIAPAAVFANDYILNYRGASLTVGFGAQGTQDDVFQIIGSQDENVIYMGKTIGTILRTNGPGSVTVVFNGRASADALQHTLRAISFHNTAENVRTAPRWCNVEFAAAPFGRLTLPLLIQVFPSTGPRYAPFSIINAGKWLSGAPPVLITRSNSAVVIGDASETMKTAVPHPGWAPWLSESGWVRGDRVRNTNEFELGVHYLWISLPYYSHVDSPPVQSFEVMPPSLAAQRILQAARSAPARRRIVPSIQLALVALEQKQYAGARRLLRHFIARVDRHVAPISPDIAAELTGAAHTLETALIR